MDMSLSKLWEIVKDREAWHAAIHGVLKSWTWPRDWTETTHPHCELGWTLLILKDRDSLPQSFTSCVYFLCFFGLYVVLIFLICPGPRQGVVSFVRSRLCGNQGLCWQGSPLPPASPRPPVPLPTHPTLWGFCLSSGNLRVSEPPRGEGEGTSLL